MAETEPRTAPYKLPKDNRYLVYMNAIGQAKKFMPHLPYEVAEPWSSTTGTPGTIKIQKVDWNRYLPDVIATQRIGYAPTFWQDPQRVARYQHAIKMAPPGWKAPEWMNVQALDDAYKWFEYRNSNKPWTEWEFLPKDDPGLKFMANMQTPPDEYLVPKDRYPRIRRSLSSRSLTLTLCNTRKQNIMPSCSSLIFHGRDSRSGRRHTMTS
jgi:hypothetical protein